MGKATISVNVADVKAGSGYWSQDGAVQVLGAPAPPDFVHVIWPGGRRSVHPVPPQARSVTVKLEDSSPR